MSTWKQHVETLMQHVENIRESRDLDTVTILRLLRDHHAREMVVEATERYQRKIAHEILWMLCDAAEQQRCCWQRDKLGTVTQLCANAMEAYDWHEDEAQRKLALGECLCCAAVAAHTEARYEHCPECGKAQPIPDPEDAPSPPNDLEGEAS